MLISRMFAGVFLNFFKCQLPFSRDAALMPMRECIRHLTTEDYKTLSLTEIDLPIQKNHFETAIKKISPSVSADDVKKYKIWMDEYGAE